MANIIDVPQNFSTTLNVAGGINNSQTTGIVLTSVSELPTDGGILCFDWSASLDTAVAEYIEYTGISGNELTGVTRGQEGFSAKAHSNGAVVAGVISRAHIKRIKDNFTAEHDRSTGAHATASVVTPTATQTLTNKRMNRRILSATSYTTDTGTSLNCNNLDEFIVTAQAGALLFNNPTGTAVDGQILLIAVTGTAARALTYGNQFEASTAALPTTTVTTARLNMVFVWRADTSKWVFLGST